MNAKAEAHGRRYPWADLFRRGYFVLHRGQDYDAMSHGMASTARQAAQRLRSSGAKVGTLHIAVYDDRIEVRVGGQGRARRRVAVAQD